MRRLYAVLFFLVFGGWQQLMAQKPINIRNATRINTAAREFAPTFYQNGLVFVTSRVKGGALDKQTGEPFYELYYAELDRQGVPLAGEPFSMEINSYWHENQASFNRAGDRVFFSRSNQQNGVTKSDNAGKIRMKIYEADRGAFDWENLRELSFDSDKYSCMHPTLSYDGTRLFFASNMPGGLGGMDLYVSDWDGAHWSEPVNLGPDINTARNEVFPYYHDNGALFFASEGHRGLGGLDIFMVDVSGAKWGNVSNLGAPINTSSDDFGLVLDKESEKGFFASDRPGGLGKDDIYFFETEGGFTGMKPLPSIALHIVVQDDDTGRPAANTNLRVFERSSDGLIKDGNTYSTELTPSADNNQNLVLRLIRKDEDELGAPTLVTNRDGEGTMQIAANKEYVILASKAGYHSKEVVYLPKPEEAKGEIKIRISPANCVTLKGKVLSEGYGKPVPNALIRITSPCFPGKNLEVRTNLEGAYEYCLDLGCEFVLEGSKEGYKKGQLQVSTVNLRGSRSFTANIRVTPLSSDVVRKPLAEGTIIILENIYYDFNKSNIRTGDAHDLESLVALMKKYPTMEVELGAHTDSRGAEAYNLQLSLRRAESARNFLIQQGIAAYRIKAVGYGESQLRNKCTDEVNCTEAEHQYNRRTEVKVTKIDEPATFEQPNDSGKH